MAMRLCLSPLWREASLFRLTTEPILGPISEPPYSIGAVITFEGRVRNINAGKTVIRLEYDSYRELAEREGLRILEDAKARFRLETAICVHRVGMLELGEVAIRVEVTAAHRRAAFEACEWIVDEVKRTVPIWKKEHYADGHSGWLNIQAAAPTESDYYSRQIRLPELGEQGQEKLRSASVLVVGAGGLGCPALLYLAAAGVGRLGVCEPDTVEISNLHRQILYTVDDVGLHKSEVAADKLRRLNPFIQVEEIRSAICRANATRLCSGYDFILDCTDNFQTKFLLNDCAVGLGKTLVSASIYKSEGQIFTCRPGGPCLRCLWPQQPPADCVGNCAEVGIFGFVAGVFGCLQAAQAIRAILGQVFIEDNLTFFDLETLETKNMSVPNDPNCPATGNVREEIPPWELQASSKDDLAGFTLIDVREAEELQNEPLPFELDAWAPMSATRPEAMLEIADGPILLVCRSGSRTARIASYLYGLGETRVFSLAGGRRTLQALFP